MIKKTKIALGVATATLTMAGTLVSPQALAQTQAERVAEAAAKKTAALESQVNDMAVMMQAMQAELSRVKAASKESATEAKVMELDQWMASMKHAPAPVASKDHMVFFRGGFGGQDRSREGSILTDANALNEGTGGNVGGLGVTTSQLTGNSPNGDDEGWYFGAGFEFNLTNDLFGMMDGTSVLGEVTVGYKEFSTADLNRAPLGTAANDSATGAAGVGAVAAAVCGGAGGAAAGLVSGGAGPYGSCSANVAVTQITLTAAPKIKFMHGSKLRPWIIPAGFGLHVISPPSDGVTVTAPGIFFGGGVDYQIWNNIHAGFDGRYHLVSNTVADVSLDGYEVGGYVGFGF